MLPFLLLVTLVAFATVDCEPPRLPVEQLFHHSEPAIQISHRFNPAGNGINRVPDFGERAVRCPKAKDKFGTGYIHVPTVFGGGYCFRLGTRPPASTGSANHYRHHYTREDARYLCRSDTDFSFESDLLDFSLLDPISKQIPENNFQTSIPDTRTMEEDNELLLRQGKGKSSALPHQETFDHPLGDEEINTMKGKVVTGKRTGYQKSKDSRLWAIEEILSALNVSVSRPVRAWVDGDFDQESDIVTFSTGADIKFSDLARVLPANRKAVEAQSLGCLSIVRDPRNGKSHLSVVPECIGAILPQYICMAAAIPSPANKYRKMDRMGMAEDEDGPSSSSFLSTLRRPLRLLLAGINSLSGDGVERQLGSGLFMERFTSTLGQVCRAHGIIRTIDQVSGFFIGGSQDERRRRRRRRRVAIANRLMNAFRRRSSQQGSEAEGTNNKRIVNLGQVLIDKETF